MNSSINFSLRAIVKSVVKLNSSRSLQTRQMKAPEINFLNFATGWLKISPELYPDKVVLRARKVTTNLLDHNRRSTNYAAASRSRNRSQMLALISSSKFPGTITADGVTFSCGSGGSATLGGKVSRRHLRAHVNRKVYSQRLQKLLPPGGPARRHREWRAEHPERVFRGRRSAVEYKPGVFRDGPDVTFCTGNG